jgi:methyltransferase-like protein
VTEELAAVQGMVKQAMQDSEEKLKNPITTQMTDEIVAQEVQAKEKITTAKETFEKLIVTLKGAQQKA